MSVRINGKAVNRAVAASKPRSTGVRLGEAKKTRKYRNEKTVIDGITFDSKREAGRYQELKALASRKLIEHLQHQVPFELAPAVKFSSEGRKKLALRYVADFAYWLDGKFVVEDVKSPATAKAAAYRIKRHLMLSVHGIEIQEVK